MKEIFTADEFASKLGISKRILADWDKEDLVKPSGTSDEGIPLYTAGQYERGQHLKKLHELGYGFDDIKKIIKKVGLPKGTAEDGKQNLNDTYLTVGQIAESVKVSPRTIKHWEEMGIIEPDMRSEGGYRLYSRRWVLIASLIKDLQLFGYSLDEIKKVSDYFRVFLDLSSNLETHKINDADEKLNELLIALDGLFDKMELFKAGISRWEDLLKKKKKEIISLKQKNAKRPVPATEDPK